MKKYLPLVFCAWLLSGFITAANAQPTPCSGLASITGPDTVCTGTEIVLSDATTGGNWSSSNIAIATIDPVYGIVTGISGGPGTITYALSPGCYVTKPVFVAPLPITGMLTICAGASGLFNDPMAGGTWSSSNTSVATINSSTGTANAAASGTTNISYTLANGCTAKVTLTVNPLPVNYYVFGGGDYCAGTSGATVALNGSDTGINYKVYNGSMFMDSLHGTGAALYFGPYTMAGNYTIVAVNIYTGCTSNMSGIASVGITPLNIPSVSISAPTGDTVCVLVSSIFTALPVNGGVSPAYEWFVNGAGVGTGPTYSYVAATGDVVSVTLYSDAVCAIPSSATSAMTMTAIPKVIPSVSLNVTPGDTVCEYIPVTIVPTPVYGGHAPVYRWIKNGIGAGTGAVFHYIPANGDNIFCVIYSDYQCLEIDSAYSTNNINMVVAPLLVPTVTITANPGTRLGAGESDTLAAIVINGGTAIDYQWAINGVPVPGATTDTFTSNSFANNDSVSCIVTSTNFCGGTPAGDTIVITDTVSHLGIQQVAMSNNISLIPNPTNGEFTISGILSTESEAATIAITNLLGQVVYKNILPVRSGRLNTLINTGNVLPNGVYLIQLTAGDSNLLKRLIINR